jgi:two-component system, NarL family, nitrate/nitrite response regulator NarL
MGLSCLIVDDSIEFLTSASRLLSRQGLSIVGQASSGDEAVALVASLKPDVALVDVELGDEDGIELARRLTSLGSRTRVILISFRDRVAIEELMTGSGAIGFLRKDAIDATAIAQLLG